MSGTNTEPPQYGGRDPRIDAYAEGYKAGRIAALREVECWKMWAGADCRQRPITYAQWCRRCRLLAEAESGEDTGEVGDDR